MDLASKKNRVAQKGPALVRKHTECPKLQIGKVSQIVKPLVTPNLFYSGQTEAIDSHITGDRLSHFEFS